MFKNKSFKINSNSVNALVLAMEKMINLNEKEIKEMGVQSRKIAEEKFDDFKVNQSIIKNII